MRYAILIPALCIAAAGCASGGDTAAPSGAASACSPDMIAVSPSEKSSFPEALAALRQTNWVSATTTVVEAAATLDERARRRVHRALVASYPLHLRYRGLGGEVTLLLLIDATGKVIRTHLVQGSSYPELNEAAAHVARVMRFHAPTYDGCRVASVMALPFLYRSGNIK